MSPQARSAPLARRLQAAKAEPTKPAALAPNPDLKPVAKPSRRRARAEAGAPAGRGPGPGPAGYLGAARAGPGAPAQPTASEPGPAAEAPALDPRAVLVRDFDWKRLPATPLRVSDVPPGVACRLGTLAYSHAHYNGRPALALRTRRGTFPWRYDWPVDDTVVSCQVALTPDGPTAVWLRLRPDRLPASRRMHEIFQVVYRVWERGRVEIGEYLAALIDAES